MQYVLTWTRRTGAGGRDNEETARRVQDVFAKWSPSAGLTYHQFVARLDGQGGFTFVETDDPSALASDVLVFSAYYDFTVHPVVNAQEIVAPARAAIALRDSV